MRQFINLLESADQMVEGEGYTLNLTRTEYDPYNPYSRKDAKPFQLTAENKQEAFKKFIPLYINYANGRKFVDVFIADPEVQAEFEMWYETHRAEINGHEPHGHDGRPFSMDILLQKSNPWSAAYESTETVTITAPTQHELFIKYYKEYFKRYSYTNSVHVRIADHVLARRFHLWVKNVKNYIEAGGDMF